eukprot:TRINITY_DN66626_c0_g1_i1.p1 TRINITY_DN66626_c0_g1~~TRINITY_DN66626_c0_g1_i1.p1  ORF type:complete len:687 (-),score=81.87 TRINITY_DN66626_c0_g1_i1:47-2035(-)
MPAFSKCCSWQEQGSCGKLDAPTAQVQYEMHVVPLDVFMEMQNAIAHQDLQKKGVLQVVYPETRKDMVVIFVSHQWLGFRHPDPAFEQLKVLQAVIRKLRGGHEIRSSWSEYAVHGKVFTLGDWPSKLQDNSVLWYDYFSIPQQVGYDPNATGDMLKAVDSIPAYVEMTDYFVVLCPTCEHSEVRDGNAPRLCNYYTWKTRGWCRMESFSQYLSTNRTPLIIIKSETCIELESLSEEIFCAPGLGEFSCCAMDHKVKVEDGSVTEIACDRWKIARVLNSMAKRRQQFALTQSNVFQFRWFKAIHKPVVMQGLQECSDSSAGCSVNPQAVKSNGAHAYETSRLEVVQKEECTELPKEEGATDEVIAKRFLEEYRFEGIEDNDAGWTPLRFAVIANEPAVVKALLSLGASIEVKVDRPMPAYLHFKGTTVLGTAMAFCRGDDGRKILDMLLEHKADTQCKTADFHVLSPVGIAAYFANKDALIWWLGRFPQWDISQPEGSFGHDLLALTMQFADPRDIDASRALVERGTDVNTAGYLNASKMMLSCANMKHDSTVFLQLMLESGGFMQMDLPRTPVATDLKILTRVGHIATWFGSTDPLMTHLKLYDGATALLGAVDAGKINQARWLLANRADANIANSCGVTPLKLAHATGQSMLIRLLEGSS